MLAEAIVQYRVANLLLNYFEDHTETALLLKCLKSLGDVYSSMGNEQEAKKFHRGFANVKKKLKPKKLLADNVKLPDEKKPTPKKLLVDDDNLPDETASVVESCF